MYGYVQYDVTPIRGPLANAFIILINTLFFNVRLIGITEIYPRDYSGNLLKEDEVSFDFIIVGAGAAGCALANRLTDQEKWSILLIEAGDYPSASSEVPGLYTTLVGSQEDWNFRIENERRACQAYQQKVCIISRGKVLGGTSTINDMLYIRGLPEDYDRNHFDRWNSNITYHIFERIESYHGSDESFFYPYGSKGLIHLEYHNYTSRSKRLLENAYFKKGSKKIPKRHSIGMISHPLMIKNGERVNMAKAFLTPIKERPNLLFSKNTEVQGIVVTETLDKRANGVNVSIDGIKFFLRARKEVILTAGAINNAKLLLVSGLGPRDYLREKKLPVVINLPGVGKNLQLHITVPIYMSIHSNCSNNLAPPMDYYYETDLIKDTFDYVMFRKGNFRHVGIDEFVNYILTKQIGTTLPNLAVHHMYFKINDRNLLAWLEGSNYVQSIKNSIVAYNKEKSILLFLLTLVSPLSKGEILLNNTHYLSNPIIKANFFTDQDNMDYQTILSGFDFISNLTDSMGDYDAQLLDLDVPNCRNFKFCTLKYVQCYIENMAYAKSDVVGTTKMGPECDEMAVVKENLEVRKVRCLRVADSSVLNHMILDNTVATDAMIGYNMGEILKEKWIKDYEIGY